VLTRPAEEFDNDVSTYIHLLQLFCFFVYGKFGSNIILKTCFKLSMNTVYITGSLESCLVLQ
jgi:hypothetical protein